MKMVRKIFSALLVVILVGSLGFTFFTISDTFSQFNNSVVSRINDATLADASITKPNITLMATYWQQISDPCINPYDYYAKDSARQFEWSECGYHYDAVTKGLVEPRLDESFLPIPSYDSSIMAKLDGATTANRGIYGDNFTRWFHSVDNLSSKQDDIIKLTYSADDDTYLYANASFHPAGDGLFTMNLAIPFQVAQGSSIEVTADDDTWVFLNDTLVLDLGGIHHPTTASFNLDNDGILYIFHANRDSAESVFNLKMSHCTIPTSNTALAYDESSYIAPLGESTTFAPNHDDVIVDTITIEFTILGVLILLTPFVVRIIMRH